MPDYSGPGITGTVGFNTPEGPALCGGWGGRRNQNQCNIYKLSQWVPFTNMTINRRGASAIEVNKDQTLIIGGMDDWGDGYGFKTTELISSSSSEAVQGKHFPVSIHKHCSFVINATHALITGGWQDGSRSASTWWMDLTTTTFKQGPTMKTDRYNHGCSIFKHGTQTFGIVSGGMKKGNIPHWRHLDTTEIIDLDQESPRWMKGMQDKSKIVYL